MNAILHFLLFFAVLCAPLCAQQPTRVQDAECWQSALLTKEISPRWSLSANPQLRLENNVSRVKTAILSFSANYKASKWYTVSPSFRYSWRRQQVTVMRFFADQVFKQWLGDSDFQLNLRVRLQAERIMQPQAEPSWVYTARFRPHLLWKPNRKSWEFTLLSFEAYIGNSNEQWAYNRFRLSAGLAYDVSKNCKLGFNYIAQSQPFSRSAELDHIGQFTLQCIFPKKQKMSIAEHVKTKPKLEPK